jgi:hypothetical protein
MGRSIHALRRGWFLLALSLLLAQSGIAAADARIAASTGPQLEPMSLALGRWDVPGNERLADSGSRVQAGTIPAVPTFDERLEQLPRAPRVVPAASAAATPAEVKPATTAATREYVGRNRFWFPGIGINRTVYAFPCERTKPPANYMYRWGCAGKNNVYLLGHAWGVMKPLHDAYVQGKLRKGMLAVYADSKGRITKYRVTEWRVVTPDVVDWVGAQPVPTMTLQTCVGGQSQYRLNVRLIAVR